MQPFVKIDAVAAPLELSNVDTDKLIPARFLRKARGPGYEQWLFHDIRFDAEGKERPGFVLNQAPYRAAKIIVAGANFGCGSSREAAVYVMWDYGIRAVIAPSFGEIHYGNELQCGMLPVVLPAAAVETLQRQLREQPGAKIGIDLERQQVTGPDRAVYPFSIDAGSKERLMKGLDDIGLVMQHIGEIEKFEQRRHEKLPWLQ
jgi:3-isopropylmalate/(R)-2-methylmalate dehydratase small subunit